MRPRTFSAFQCVQNTDHGHKYLFMYDNPDYARFNDIINPNKPVIK